MNNFKYALIGLFICVGLGLSGYFIGHGLSNFRQDKKIIHTKGIGEKDVYADYAIWRIRFFVSEKDFDQSKEKYEKGLDIILSFLKERDFKDSDIQVMVPEIIQNIERDPNDQYKRLGETYEITGTVVVKTEAVKKVQSVSQETFQLLKKGIWLKEDRFGTNPRYIIRDFDRFRPEIFAEAIDSSYRMAQKLAEKAGVSIGRVKSVDQGNFSIKSRIGNENEEAYPEKKVRVVSYVTYEIER